MSHLYLDVVIIASERQKGSQTTYTYHTNDTVLRGAIVYVPLLQQIVIAVVVHTSTQSPVFRTKEIISVTPFRMSDAQIDLADWMARHYRASLATILGLFVTTAVVPAPERRWTVTTAGIHVDLAELPVDERSLLYLLQHHHVMNEPDIRSHTQLSKSTLAQLRKWLVARGYVDITYHVESLKSAIPVIKMIRYVDSTNVKLTALQGEFIEHLKQLPEMQMALRDVKSASIAKRLVQSNVCQIIEVPISQAPIRAPVTLSPEQTYVAQQVINALRSHQTFLLDGVTGSGKTEVYFALIDACLAQQKQVLVLVPEIALTTQLAERFSTRFPGRVGVVHGQITATHRRRLWEQSLENSISIIIGPRSALYVPQTQLGLIIVDEEHDASYKSEFAPFVNARDAAVMYAKIANIPVVLGSATPSVELIHAVAQQRITHLKLTHRLDKNGNTIPRPSVRVIDMRSERSIDEFGLIGESLASEMTTCIDDNQHVLLLLNRRGNSGVRMCRACGEVSRCNHCSTPMSTHIVGARTISVCHTCGAQRHLDLHCRACYHTEFVEFGSGTQRVSEILRTQFPHATVVQWDRDTADSAHDHRTLLAQVESTEKVIIVGTQMIAKGLDLPKIRLVGVINTDIALHLPDFRAAERTYQLLTQVAGRAGRREATAHVIFQSYQPDNYAIQAAARYNSEDFYQQELAYRQHLDYPPYQRMIKLVWTHRDAKTCERIAKSECNALNEHITRVYPHARIIGPGPAFFTRIREVYRWQIIIVTPAIRPIFAHLEHAPRAIVDVDPVSLL